MKIHKQSAYLLGLFCFKHTAETMNDFLENYSSAAVFHNNKIL